MDDTNLAAILDEVADMLLQATNGNVPEEVVLRMDRLSDMILNAINGRSVDFQDND